MSALGCASNDCSAVVRSLLGFLTLRPGGYLTHPASRDDELVWCAAQAGGEVADPYAIK